jgi:AbrB family looped-hinge helix DNA binding protein
VAAATLTSNGQVSIPLKVRADLGIAAGDRIEFVRLQYGAYAIMPASGSIRA